MRIISVIFCCERDADKLVWARASLSKLGIECIVISDPQRPVPGIAPLDDKPFSDGVSLAGKIPPQSCVDKMLIVSNGYDAVLKMDADTILLDRWWESLDSICALEGLKRQKAHPDDQWHVSGACYLIQRHALQAISGHELLSDGWEDQRVTKAVRACGFPVRAPLYRFPYPRGLAYWDFKSPDDPRYDGAKAILFGIRFDGRTERIIADAMAEYCRAHGITP